MPDLVTTKPGDKYASIRNPRMYRALRRRGYSKESAAKITNARGKSVDDLERAVEAGQPQVIIDAIAAQCDELPRFKGEQLAPGITRIRGNLCNVHGRYGKCPGAAVAAPKPPAPKPGKGGRARKPVKTPKPKDPATAARQAQRDQEHTEDRAQRQQDRQERMARQSQRDQERIAAQAERLRKEQEKLNKPAKGGGGSAKPAKPTADDKRQAQTQERTQRASETAATVGLGAADVSALREAAEGLTTLAEPAGLKLSQMGFIDDTGMTTDQGRRALSALERGDVRGYQAALQDARARQGREQAAAGRRAEAEQRRTETERTRQQRQVETERRRTEADQRRVARDEEKRTEPERRRAARRARRDAARNETRMQKEARSPVQPSMRLHGTTSLPGTGNTPILSGPMHRHQPISGKSASIPPSFAVYKQANGVYRWVAFSSNAYRDRDREIVSTKALADDCARADQDGSYGPLRWWHVPHVELGTCDFNAMHGRILVESGTFKDARIGARIAAKADQLQLSIGFVHPPNEPDAHGVFHNIRRFERSLVPRGRAANPWTTLAVTKESRMFDNIKRAALKTLGFSEEEIVNLSTQAQATQKDADESGATFKESEAAPAPPDEVTIGGVVYALKAPPPPLPAEEEAPPVETEMKLDEELAPMEEEPAGGLTLSPEDLTAITEVFTTAIQSALAPVVGMLDIEKKVAGHVQSMLAPYQATKDDEAARTTAELTALKTAHTDAVALVASLDARLKELEGEQPAALKAGYRATGDFQTIVGAERKKELAPDATSTANIDPIVAQLMGNGVHIPPGN